MLNSLQIKNFKCWEDTGKIELAPMTLFFGANSSGKSSIGQFLMMLKQTVSQMNSKIALYPGNQDTAVDLGASHDIVYNRDTNNTIEFFYDFDCINDVVSDPYSGVEYEYNNIYFDCAVGFDKNTEELQALSMNYSLYDLNKNNEEELLSVWMEKKKGGKKGQYIVSTDGYELIKTKGRPFELGAPGKFYAFPDEVVVSYQNADFIKQIALAHEKFFGSVYYLGPMRMKSSRLYTWNGDRPESVGIVGEDTIPALLAAQQRRYNFGFKQPGKSLQEVLANALLSMGLISSFEVSRIAEGRREYEVKVSVGTSTQLVDLPDVGFGISQVLPVLVQMYYAPPGSIIIMEQPEIHLHPSAQAALADVMLDALKAREGGKERGIQLIIETHSEHFLRRLQRRIAEDESNSLTEKTSAYFVDNGSNAATLNKLDLDNFGTIRNWPKHFFGDDMGDIAATSRAARAKRQNNG